jgi:UDP-N-acetylmuramoyl-L-alanyl-D-glutamate--2,6-diaminopimelate ligase
VNIAEALRKIKVREISGSIERRAASLSYDSRHVEPGSLFFAIKGEKEDGHQYIADAINKGARTVVYDGGVAPSLLDNPDVLFVRVEDVRLALACISATYYGEPSMRLKLTGITGTNGKTTTSFLVKAAVEAAGARAGLIGTIVYMAGGRIFPASRTTPESPEFQKLLGEMYREGCTHVVAEVSSHALAQYRVDANAFDVAVFTNLTRDHLDYHGDMEGYFKAKKRLFTELLKADGAAVLNADDEYGRKLVRELPKGVKILTYGIGARADIRAAGLRAVSGCLDFEIEYAGRVLNLHSPLMGHFNVYNLLAAFAAGVAHGIDETTVIAGISSVKSVRGRFERVDFGQDFNVVVDYAHTDDALKNLLESVRRATSGRVITVFGCGGDRDSGKRPLMGRVATTLSDYAIITSDNPRHEDPAFILKQVEKGAAGPYLVEADRRAAIKKAVAMASAGDTVVIAGKGHETYQEIKGVKHPFDDKVEAGNAIKKYSKGKKKEDDSIGGKVRSVFFG